MWLRTGSDRSKRTELYVEILAEASTAASGVLSCEHGDFGRCGSAILGFSTPQIQPPAVARWHILLHGLATAIRKTSGLGRVYIKGGTMEQGGSISTTANCCRRSWVFMCMGKERSGSFPTLLSSHIQVDIQNGDFVIA